MRKILCGVAVCALALGMGVATQAAPLTVVNHSFEDISGETQQFEFTFGPFTGWELYDPGTPRNPGLDGGDGPDYYIGTLTPQELDPQNNPGVYENFPNGAADGQRVAIAFNDQTTGGDGEYGLQQETTHVWTANTSYTLEVEIGNIASGQSLGFGFFNLNGFPGYRVELLAMDGVGGITVIAEDDNTLDGTIPEGEWATSTVSHTTGNSDPTLGQFIGIRLVNLNIVDATDPTADIEVDFDNVRLDATAIPEPASLALLGVGALTLLRRRH